MLTRAGFCNDPLLAQALRHQDLPDGIVDLVRACMTEIFPFEKNIRIVFLAQPAGKVQRRGPSYIILQQGIELLLKRGSCMISR